MKQVYFREQRIKIYSQISCLYMMMKTCDNLWYFNFINQLKNCTLVASQPLKKHICGMMSTSPNKQKSLSSLRLIDFSPNLKVRGFRDDGKMEVDESKEKHGITGECHILLIRASILESNTNLKWPKCNDKDRLELYIVYLSPKSLKFTLWISFRISIFNFSQRFSLCFTHRFSPLDCSCNFCFLPIPVTTVAFFWSSNMGNKRDPGMPWQRQGHHPRPPVTKTGLKIHH